MNPRGGPSPVTGVSARLGVEIARALTARILSVQRGTKSRGKAAPGRSRRALVPIGERFEAVELDLSIRGYDPAPGNLSPGPGFFSSHAYLASNVRGVLSRKRSGSC